MSQHTHESIYGMLDDDAADYQRRRLDEMCEDQREDVGGEDDDYEYWFRRGKGGQDGPGAMGSITSVEAWADGRVSARIDRDLAVMDENENAATNADAVAGRVM